MFEDGASLLSESQIKQMTPKTMIHNDKELKATQQRITYFQNLLLQLKAKATPEEFPLISSGYRTEIQKMQDEVLEYLMDHTKISQADSI